MEAICKRCSETKPLDEFYRQANNTNGRQSHCKKCDNARCTKRLREKSLRTRGEPKRVLTLVARELLAQGKKKCPGCKLVKEVEAFYKFSNSACGRAPYCVVCTSERIQREEARKQKAGYYQKHRRTNRDRHLQRRFGISLEHYERMLEEQGGVCAICKGTDANKSLAVDHNHQTGAVRQLLCGTCNPAVGFLQDDPLLARKVLEYLEKHEGKI